MRHHRECPDQSCQICLPLRRRLAAAKVSVAAAAPGGQAGPGMANKRKSQSKRKKDGEDDDGGDVKRKKGAHGQVANGGLDKKRKAGAGASAVIPSQEQAPALEEQDLLESGFCVSVHFGFGKRHQAGDDGRGEWKSGIVMRTYLSMMQGHETGGCTHSTASSTASRHTAAASSQQQPQASSHTLTHTLSPPLSSLCTHSLRHYDGRRPRGEGRRALPMPYGLQGVPLGQAHLPSAADVLREVLHRNPPEMVVLGGGRRGGRPQAVQEVLQRHQGEPAPNRLLCDLAHRGNLDIHGFIEKKEKDRPEYVDNWVQCDECHSWMHWTCGLYKGEDTPDDCLFFCDTCRLTRGKVLDEQLAVPASDELGMDVLSTRLQDALRSELKEKGVTCNPVTVRVVSNIETKTKFDQQPFGAVGAKKDDNVLKDKVREFPYRSKCILAFQHVEGHEVCFFAMYVQEYGSDCPEPNTNRVYISYLDSVRYFVSSPENQRTTVYHSMLINYLAYAKELGFTHAHIWVSPPKQGDDYIFYAHPETMVTKRMGLLKLKEWYEKMLVVAKQRSIVADFQDMQEEYKDIESIDDIPMFSGDHWAASIVQKMQILEQKKEDAEKGALGLDEKGGEKNSHKKKKTTAMVSQSVAAAAGLEDDTPDLVDAALGGKDGAGGKGKDEEDGGILKQIEEEMRSMRNHFIVVKLHPEDVLKRQKKEGITIVDPVPLISNEFVDTRSAFLEKCQMYHWQFDELRNAQHSTLMLLYYLHGKHKVAKEKMKLQMEKQGTEPPPERKANVQDPRSRSSKIETAMHDWSTLLSHANKAAANNSWELPPDELFQRILAQVHTYTHTRLARLCSQPAHVPHYLSSHLPVCLRTDQPLEARYPTGEVQCVLRPQLLRPDAVGLHPRAKADRRVVYDVLAADAVWGRDEPGRRRLAGAGMRRLCAALYDVYSFLLQRSDERRAILFFLGCARVWEGWGWVGKVRDGTTKRVQRERERVGLWCLGRACGEGKRATAERKCERERRGRERGIALRIWGWCRLRACVCFACRRESDRESEQRGVVACRRRNV